MMWQGAGVDVVLDLFLALDVGVQRMTASFFYLLVPLLVTVALLRIVNGRPKAESAFPQIRLRLM